MVTTRKIALDEGERQREHAESVRAMFARIARRYDLLNHLLSANVDRRWRRLVAERVAFDERDRAPALVGLAAGHVEHRPAEV